MLLVIANTGWEQMAAIKYLWILHELSNEMSYWPVSPNTFYGNWTFPSTAKGRGVGEANLIWFIASIQATSIVHDLSNGKQWLVWVVLNQCLYNHGSWLYVGIVWQPANWLFGYDEVDWAWDKLVWTPSGCTRPPGGRSEIVGASIWRNFLFVRWMSNGQQEVVCWLIIFQN